MPLEHPDAQYLLSAIGYVELGMFIDADRELDCIDPDVRHLPDVLDVRVQIYRGAEKWGLMQAVSKKLAEYDPTSVEWTVNYAYAARRAESLEKAKAILLAAVERNAEPAVYHFNLACYFCQLGDLAEARIRLAGCFKRDKSYRQVALEDPDLEPLWESLGTSSSVLEK